MKAKRIIKLVIIYIKTFFLRRIDKTVHFTGKKYISIGKNTIISQNTWLNVNSRNFTPKIIIGNNCYIGRNNFFTSGRLIIIDDYVITSVNCCFLGAEHDYSNPLIPYYFSSTTENAVISIGLNVFVGANVSLIGSVDIGYGSVLGANTVICNKLIPPFSLVTGNPGVISKRFSFYANQWIKCSEWSSVDEENLISIDNYRLQLNKVKIYKYMLPLKSVGKGNGNLAR